MSKARMNLTIPTELYLAIKANIKEGQISQLVTTFLENYLQFQDSTREERESIEHEIQNKVESITKLSTEVTILRMNLLKIDKQEEKESKERFQNALMFAESVKNSGLLHKLAER